MRLVEGVNLEEDIPALCQEGCERALFTVRVFSSEWPLMARVTIHVVVYSEGYTRQWMDPSTKSKTFEITVSWSPRVIRTWALLGVAFFAIRHFYRKANVVEQNHGSQDTERQGRV
jgi:hypothetical protein